MNKLTIIGNATKDPELRTTPDGKSVCNFTLAVNRRKKTPNQPEADFFRVSAWNGLAENCAKYITRGKKVAVIGAVSVHPYQTGDGKPAANLEVLADEVEFISPRQEATEEVKDQQTGFTQVSTGDLPF